MMEPTTVIAFLDRFGIVEGTCLLLLWHYVLGRRKQRRDATMKWKRKHSRIQRELDCTRLILDRLHWHLAQRVGEPVRAAAKPGLFKRMLSRIRLKTRRTHVARSAGTGFIADGSTGLIHRLEPRLTECHAMWGGIRQPNYYPHLADARAAGFHKCCHCVTTHS